MPRSITDICNVGAGMVGADPVTSVFPPEDGNKVARLCNLFYKPVVDEILVRHEWGCAKHTKVVTSDAAYVATDFDYKFAYRFALPSNPWCLFIRKFNDGQTEYKKEGRLIYSDASTCELVYTKRITDTNEFDPLLAEAISTQLGIKLSFPLQQTNQLRIELIEYLETVVLQQARAADAGEKYTVRGKKSWAGAGR
jgi:hypothetical protein